jgi:protein farnesyltransferase/geranylgeranyltransferase type-1 subunit alpha
MPHIPYGSRPEWVDVAPIPQADTENPVVAIQYSAEFTDAMNYFRAVRTPRVRCADAWFQRRILALPAAECESQSCAALLTVAASRAQVLAKDERSERALQLTEHVISLNAANYTVWVYRRAICESLGRSASDELAWVSALARDNPKNYQVAGKHTRNARLLH